ncbi:putative phenylalanyl-tRNA synthetase beta chain [Tripterygium wilfordii]|uniref:phenylalanine--tRNA ligase n=1 Tax=Tripterygium wilfordii TaxID=458696 RepID=A0A7J7E2E3_TRIWF|nr:putative phenylalanyl-tRNA synthetase beta chain [Tripterygium wilfordii]
MPTVSVGRDRLFNALGKTYTQEEFEDLCFRFGIELDDVTTEKEIIRKELHLEESKTVAAGDDEEIIYKIEVPANRYDLLCLEGIAQALRVFLGEEERPTYNLAEISKKSMLKMHVKPETSLIRPFVVCAVLRGMTFDEASYKSFIDLQDKLHQNICRRRTLVAIGTHDLDRLQGPFSYEALPPADINFVPLKQDKNFRADELMEFYRSDLKLKKFLHIIENSPVFPVIYDSNRTVLSLPPIINGAHSAITLKTKNVFIECTATDLTKAKIVLNTMVTCLLNRMQLRSEQSIVNAEQCNINVTVPPTRSDVLHPCDVMEDVAIAYGYNNIPKKKLTSIKPLALNELSDLIRLEVAMNGFVETLNWILLSSNENSHMLNRDDDKTVVISNPRTSDFEVVRTSLMPGTLKTVAYNKDHPKPIKIFEVGDIACLDGKRDVGASNRRMLAALHCGANSGFELIHSLVDRVMEVMGTPFVPAGDDTGYYIKRSDAPEFLQGRQASIIYKGKCIGIFGIVHPEVLSNFGIPDPCSHLELDIEFFM